MERRGREETRIETGKRSSWAKGLEWNRSSIDRESNNKTREEEGEKNVHPWTQNKTPRHRTEREREESFVISLSKKQTLVQGFLSLQKEVRKQVKGGLCSPVFELEENTRQETHSREIWGNSLTLVCHWMSLFLHSVDVILCLKEQLKQVFEDGLRFGYKRLCLDLSSVDRIRIHDFSFYLIVLLGVESPSCLFFREWCLHSKNPWTF
jgi:hypothetical protein